MFAVITGGLIILLLLYGTVTQGFKGTSIGGFFAGAALIIVGQGLIRHHGPKV
jgi:hypothetical protein